MADFCASCGSKVNAVDKFCFKCGSTVVKPSLNNENMQISESARSDEKATKSEIKTIAQYMTSKAEERAGFSKQNKHYKRKSTDKGPSSKRATENRVVINVGIVSENEEGILAVKRGSKLALKVGKDFGSEQVLVIAIKKL